jgi:hypothetical protein
VITADFIDIDDACNITQIYTGFQGPELLSKQPAGAETALWCTGVFIYQRTVSSALPDLLAAMFRKNRIIRITPGQIARQPCQRDGAVFFTCGERTPSGGRYPVGSKRWEHLRKVVISITTVKLISRPKPTSPDAAESSGFAPRAYRASSLQYWCYSPRCSGEDAGSTDPTEIPRASAAAPLQQHPRRNRPSWMRFENCAAPRARSSHSSSTTPLERTIGPPLSTTGSIST